MAGPDPRAASRPGNQTVPGNSADARHREDAWWSTTAVQLAMISYRRGSVVNWDLEREQIVGNGKAAGWLKRPYRAPYVHPYAAG